MCLAVFGGLAMGGQERHQLRRQRRTALALRTSEVIVPG